MRLDIDIFSARGLPRINPKIRQMPHCQIAVDGVDEVFETAAVKSSSSPEWNESFTVPKVNSDSVSITLTVKHKDKIISSVNFSIDKVQNNSECDEWVQLTAENPKLKGGEIHIKLFFTDGDHEEEEVFEEDEDEVIQNKTAPTSPTLQENEEQNTTVGFSKYSPHKTPDLNRTKKKIENDEMDANEVVEKAYEEAKKKYDLFLKNRAPALIENEKMMQKVREEMDNDDD